MRFKTTLDQWLTLAEVDRAGSIQAAAQQLNKSHTTLLYAIRKLEAQLGVALVEIKGRRVVLTEDGRSLLRRAAPILEQTRALEVIGAELSRGTEAEIRVSVDHLCCLDWLYQPLARFVEGNRGTSVKVVETSLSATTEAVTSEKVDIAIINLPISNYSAEAFGVVTMVPVIARDHPLAAQPNLTLEELITETQIVIRDLGAQEDDCQDVGWLKSQQRITVDNFFYACEAVKAGLGFCRIPEHWLARVDPTEIVRLPLQGNSCYQVPTHLVLPKAGRTGPAALKLYELLLDNARQRLGH